MRAGHKVTGKLTQVQVWRNAPPHLLGHDARVGHHHDVEVVGGADKEEEQEPQEDQGGAGEKQPGVVTHALQASPRQDGQEQEAEHGAHHTLAAKQDLKGEGGGKVK